MTEQQEAVLCLVDNERYEEALGAIEKLEADQRHHGRIQIAKGDALYELGRDLDALKSYVRYTQTYPSGRGINFAFFGVAMCLKNLDLQEEARAVLGLISSNHYGLEKEREHSNQILAAQREARAVIEGVLIKKASGDSET